MRSSVDARLGYDKARNSLKEQGLNPQTAVLTQGFLQSEVTLDTTSTQFTYPILNNQQGSNGTGVQSVTEQRLQLQDAFFVTSLAFYLNVPSSGGYTGLRDNYMTYPSTAIYQNVDLDQIRVLWNAKLRLTIDNKVKVPSWDLKRHFLAPTGQRPINTAGQAYPWIFTDQLDGSQDGFSPVEPGWWLIGADNIDLTMTLPHSIGAAIFGGSTTLKGVLVFQGVLAQNSTSVR